jgi:hypothetical protein
VRGAACEGIGCEIINGLGDWNYLEIGMEMRDRCSPRKVSNDAQEFGLKHLEMAGNWLERWSCRLVQRG